MKARIFFVLAVLVAAGTNLPEWQVCAAQTAQQSSWIPKREARKILSETGIKGGLVVHLGCGDGKLTAALRAV